MFDIYTEELEIENGLGVKDKYRLQPLPGSYLGKMYAIVGKMGKDESAGLEAFDEKTVKDIHEICFETFKRSYPKEDLAKLDMFVSQNLMPVMEAVFKVNMTNKAMK